MIRRKMWATATCCLALAGAGQAQTEAPVKASLGKPQAAAVTPGYTARGAAPAFVPGYPMPAPTYTAPAAPGMAMPGYTQQYVPQQYVPQYTPQQQYVPQGVRPAAFASMQAPTPGPMAPLGPMPTPMQMPQSSAPATLAPPAIMSGPPQGVMPYPAESGPVTTVPSYTMPGPGTFGYGYNTGDCANGQCASPMQAGIPGCMDACGPTCDLPCVWMTTEYINWRGKGMDTPALVTTAPAGSLGTIGLADTTVAYGGNKILDDARSGVRIRGGMWLNKCDPCGIELGYFHLQQQRERFNAGSDGNPGFFRPFLTPAGVEDAQLVAFTDPLLGPILAGRIAVTSTTDLMGAEANVRKVWKCDPCNRVDVIYGVRYMRLRDSVSIFEDLTATSADPGAAAPLGTRIQVFDKFETENDFYGGQIGLAGERKYGNWILSYRGTVALGITRQKTTISGSTNTLTPDGDSSSSVGGLLALPTNIGTYTNDRFTVIPDLNLSLGYQLTKNIRVFGGYNFMYWSSVMRAGEQIDRTVNASFIPNPGGAAGTGAFRPAYPKNDNSYWAHGWSAGFEFRW